MAPQAPSTPEVAYKGIQTPRVSVGVQEPPTQSSRNLRNHLWGNLAQALIVVAIAVFVYGQLYVFTDLYNNNLRVSINEWWGVPHATALVNGGGAPPVKGPVIGHAEMVRPTFVFLFFVLPVVVSVLLLEYLRSFNTRRLTANALLRVAQALRRKPAFGGYVSYWSYGEWLFLVVFLILGNILAFSYGFSRRYKRAKKSAAAQKTSLEVNDYLDLIGVTLGFNAIYNMAFLFLPATRNSVWLEFFNISYANGVKYHRWLGIVTVFTAFAHCVTFYTLWVREGTWKEEALPCFDCPLDKRKGQSVWFNVFGELALLCFLAIALSSIPIVRRKFYNVFYYAHHLFLLAVVFAVMHWGPIVWWILPAFVLYLFNRALSSSNAFTPVKVKEFTALSPNLVKLVIHRVPGSDSHYTVGQFLYVNVPAISKLQWHSFTIASSARSSPTTITVVIKSLGDWTQQLVAHANELKEKNQLPTVYIDGFYGASLEMYDEYSTLCLVGGGIGATPLIAILEDLVARLQNHESIKQKLVLLFSFRELALLDELAPSIVRLRELDPLHQYVVTHITVTSAPSDELLDAKLFNKALTQPTSYDNTGLHRRAFAQPLRSRSLKSLAIVSLFFVALLLVVVLEFGHDGAKIKRHGARFWPLQQFTEIAVVIGSVVVVFAFVLVDRVRLAHAAVLQDSGIQSKDAVRDSVLSSVALRGQSVASVAGTRDSRAFLAQTLQVQSYRDLIAELGVVIGDRPDIAVHLQEAYTHHTKADVDTFGNGLIGVFASGPETLKRGVEVATAEIDSGVFDLREEQFEL